MIIGVIVDNDLNSDVRVIKEAKLLARLGHQVHVLCYGYKGKSYSDIKGLTVHRCWVSTTWKNKSFFLYNSIPIFQMFWKRHIVNFINKVKPEMIHAHDLYMSEVTKLGIEKSKFSNIKFVLDLHENFPVAVKSYNWTKGFLRHLISNPNKWTQIEGQYLSYPDKIITLSQGFKETLLNRYNFLDSKNVTPLPNVPDLEEFNGGSDHIPQLQWANPDAKVFLYFGAIAERRGIFDTIDAFKNLVNNKTNINLLLIGPVDKADKDSFNSKTKPFIENKQLIYIPWIELKDLPLYMKLSNVALAPFIKNDQHDSGIANKIFQYMYGSLPIIASNCKPQQELIEKEEIGSIFQNQEQLEQLLKDYSESNTLDEIGSKAKKVLLEKYNISLYKETMDKIFRL